LQDQIGQLSKLLGAQPVTASNLQTTQSFGNQYDLVTGLDGARDFLQKMLSGSKHIVWDNNDSIFYVLQKDANGTPSRIQICKFTVEYEPTMEEKYVSRDDFNELVSKLDRLLKDREVTDNG
jgi:hypothetical protein